jgi:SAM-dependent methyltransferase
MNIAKLLDRISYILGSPLSFLRLLHATLSNQFHRRTAGWGERRVRCNLCGWEGRHFDYFLEREFVVKDSQCPGCGSQRRNRELIDFIEKNWGQALRFKLTEGGMEGGLWVLDIAPAPGYQEWFEARGADYISIDLGERKAMALMDATMTGFADASFDIIICSHVLEHVPDYQAALRELRRVLKDDGAALIDVPFSRRQNSIRLEKPDHQGHWHEFGMDIRDRIFEAGFHVETKAYSESRELSDPDNQFFIARKVK